MCQCHDTAFQCMVLGHLLSLRPQVCGSSTAACAAQAWYMNPVFSVLIGGILPFGAVFIELFFILTSMWLHQFYYLFGFLCLVFVILIITCAEITIVLCYFQLCSEDYHWWCAPGVACPVLSKHVCAISMPWDGRWHTLAHTLPRLSGQTPAPNGLFSHH